MLVYIFLLVLLCKYTSSTNSDTYIKYKMLFVIIGKQCVGYLLVFVCFSKYIYCFITALKMQTLDI